MYDRIIDLRIATPQIIINYGMFLEENNYFEEAFKVSLLYRTSHKYCYGVFEVNSLKHFHLMLTILKIKSTLTLQPLEARR